MAGSGNVLLLLSRYREELHAGIRTGLIRTIAGSGNVAVTAAFVLAGTMLAMLSSDVVNIGQAGSTICIGLIFDMMIVAGTMLAMLSSDVVNIGQAGSTICIGLIFDMMIVRLFLVMPLARILGPWFWWPQKLPSPKRAAFRDEPEHGESATARM
nr:MMPL family transporter [Mycobacteroides immunogenum]